jgi:hypothetical protein
MFSKSRRAGGTAVQYEGVEEAEPFWTPHTVRSIHIFGPKSNPISDLKHSKQEVLTFTFPARTEDIEEAVEEATEMEEDAEPMLKIVSEAPSPASG